MSTTHIIGPLTPVAKSETNKMYEIRRTTYQGVLIPQKLDWLIKVFELTYLTHIRPLVNRFEQDSTLPISYTLSYILLILIHFLT